MNILIIRHAEPDYDRDSLTKRGFVQADALAEYLSKLPATSIYCSPYGRAKATMLPTSQATGIEPITLHWLREMDKAGEDWHFPWTFTPQTWLDENRLSSPEKILGSRIEEVVSGWYDLLEDLGFARSGSSYMTNARWKHGRLVLLFSHAAFTMTLVSRLFGIPLKAAYTMLGYMPTGITHLQMCKDPGLETWHVRLLSYGCRPHLDIDGTYPLTPARY